MSARELALKVYFAQPVQKAIEGWVKLTGRDRRISNRYLASHARRGLHIGAGGNIRPGWLNTNWYPIRPWFPRAIFMDATKKFPLPDDSFDFIFTEHMIEHVPFDDGQNMLAESYRVLRPGGTIRISTPDIAFLVDLLRSDLTQTQVDYVKWASKVFLKHGEPHTPLSVVNNFVRDWGHTYIYDQETLQSCLKNIGYVSIRRCDVNQSDVAELDKIDHPERFPHPEFLQLESTVYEATKPIAPT